MLKPRGQMTALWSDAVFCELTHVWRLWVHIWRPSWVLHAHDPRPAEAGGGLWNGDPVGGACLTLSVSLTHERKLKKEKKRKERLTSTGLNLNWPRTESITYNEGPNYSIILDYFMASRTVRREVWISDSYWDFRPKIHKYPMRCSEESQWKCLS